MGYNDIIKKISLNSNPYNNKNIRKIELNSNYSIYDEISVTKDNSMFSIENSYISSQSSTPVTENKYYDNINYIKRENVELKEKVIRRNKI